MVTLRIRSLPIYRLPRVGRTHDPQLSKISLDMQRENTDIEPQWTSLPPNIRSSIVAAWSNNMPPVATALYGRWWQLETWLRSLIYVELRAAFGSSWADKLPKDSENRQDKEQTIQHMATPDAQARLAYTDASTLFSIIDKHWELFEAALITKSSWMGRVGELSHIRNRIGHCRRPHTDDLARLEQMLRDLEGGAFCALSAFNRQWPLEADRNEPLVKSWVNGEHEVATRLLKHAHRQYETSFTIRWSCRPWAKQLPAKDSISGTKGYLWHAQWYFRGDRFLDLRAFWNDGFLQISREPILFVCASDSSSLEISFSALEDPDVVADAIGDCFDAALTGLRYGRDIDNDYASWTKLYADLDPRVQAGGPWSIVDDSTQPITLFSA